MGPFKEYGTLLALFQLLLFEGLFLISNKTFTSKILIKKGMKFFDTLLTSPL